jgi:zinc protease
VKNTIARRVLDNGLTVLAEPRGLGSVVFSGIVYRVGSRDERPGLTGISHLLEHMMFKGTERFGKGEVAALVERHGGELNAFTSEDVTMYYEVFARDRWQLALEIEAERIARLRIDAAELEAERQVILEERAMYLDIPVVRLHEELMAATFRESPYRCPVIGWEGDIRGIRREDLTDHYRRFYSPHNAALVVVGDVDAAEVFAAAEKHFGAIDSAEEVERRIPREPELQSVTRVELHGPGQLPYLQILLRAPEIRTRESEALFLLANVLCGTRTSRLDIALLETNRAGDVSMQYHAKADPSALLLTVEVRPGVPLKEIEDIVWAEFAKLATNGVTAEELERALNQVEAHHVFAFQSPAERGFVLGWHEAQGAVEYADEVVSRLHDLSADELRDTAARLFRRDRCGIATWMPEGNGEGGGERRETVPGLGAAALHGVRCPRRRFRSGLPCARRVERRRLANGMRVLLQPDRTDPIVSFTLVFAAGSALDGDERQGLATLTASTLERGPRSQSFVEFSRRFERIGSSLSVDAGAELAQLGATFLARHAQTGLEQVAELLAEPGFRAEDLAVTRELALSDVDVRAEDLDDLAEDLFLRAVADGHPYAKLPHGTHAGLAAIEREDLLAFYQSAYRPDEAHLALVGDFDLDIIGPLLEERYGRLPVPGGAPPVLPPLPETASAKTVVRTVAEKGQARIFFGGRGFSSTDPDRLAGVALNRVLGGSSIRSRLGDEIRDTRGLAYSIYSRNNERAVGGFFWVHMGTRPENVRAAVAAIREELARLPAGVTAQELDDARDYLTGSFPLRFTTYGHLARFWSRSSFYGWPEDYLETYVQRVRALRREDLQRIAVRLVAEANVLAVTGPITETLAPAASESSPRQR